VCCSLLQNIFPPEHVPLRKVAASYAPDERTNAGTLHVKWKFKFSSPHGTDTVQQFFRTKFHTNPFSRLELFTCVRTDEWTYGEIRIGAPQGRAIILQKKFDVEPAILVTEGMVKVFPERHTKLASSSLGPALTRYCNVRDPRTYRDWHATRCRSQQNQRPKCEKWLL
jgi:hypothetical protein